MLTNFNLIIPDLFPRIFCQQHFLPNVLLSSRPGLLFFIHEWGLGVAATCRLLFLKIWRVHNLGDSVAMFVEFLGTTRVALVQQLNYNLKISALGWIFETHLL